MLFEYFELAYFWTDIVPLKKRSAYAKENVICGSVRATPVKRSGRKDMRV